MNSINVIITHYHNNIHVHSKHMTTLGKRMTISLLINRRRGLYFFSIFSVTQFHWKKIKHKTSLTPPHFIEVPVLSRECEQSCICVRGIYFVSFYVFDISS